MNRARQQAAALSMALDELESTRLAHHIANLREELRRAWATAEPFAECFSPRAERLVVAGMGGSASAADIVAGLAQQQTGASDMVVHRGYGLPRRLRARTQLVVSSYSGETEETLSVFREAIEAGLRPGIITAGGQLLSMGQERQLPLFLIDYEAPPRHSFAWSFPPLLRVAHRMHLLSTSKSAFERALDSIDAAALGELSVTARRLADAAATRVVVVYGAEFLAPVARRWKNQLNENAKQLAFADEIPEGNHNSIMGLDFPSALPLSIFILQSELYASANFQRCTVAAEVMRSAQCAVEVISAGTGSALSQALRLVALGDLVSLFLAQRNGVAAIPIERISTLKSRLARRAA